MPFGPRRPVRGRSSAGCLLAASAWLACSAPDASGLFQPFTAGGPSGSSGSASSVGAASGSGGGSSGSGAAEGQGGSLALAGAAGTSAAGVATAGAVAEDAGVDAAGIDAGSALDAAAPPPPVTCVDPSAEVCDGIDNDCDDQIDPGLTCPDECLGFVLAGRGYMFCTEGVDREIALTRCEVEDMKLAWIETLEENDALVSAIAALDLVDDGVELVTQIGASDAGDEDEWIWVGNGATLDGFQFWEGNAGGNGGAPVDGAYQSWAEGEPNDSDGEDCGVLSVSGTATREPGQWDDRNCDEAFPFLCEVP